ncbi:heterokaryon incompatibility protein-domain-containing protein [Annulohypoxylon moriforme]|nr:heterokaryon incompatibility protein-domain-containing protein [Annulohypoxylon moriforme]
MPYTYEDVKEGEFRVARLLPGYNTEAIQIELSVEALNKPTEEYDALSWQWGSGGETTSASTIYIQNKGEKDKYELMLVRPNLLLALKRMRRVPKLSRLWVDFICINQSNPKEKESQVTRMTDIYRKAERVHVWLGEPGYAGEPEDFTGDELEIAVQHIDTLWDMDDANHIGSVDIGIRNKASLHNLDPLFKLLKRGWFSRRWIVQEVGVAREAVVHCGDKAFSWEKLIHAVALLERVGRDGSIDRLFKLRPDTRHVSEYVGNISALPAYRLVQNVSGLYRELSRESRIKQYTLEQLVCFLVIFQCSEPRDVIYAILGIASDVEPLYERSTSNQPVNYPPSNAQTNSGPVKFPVRYKDEEPLELYIRFLKHAIGKSKSLDILCRPWAPAKMKSKLPSWILDETRKPFRETTRNKMIRYNPDPFVGAAVRRKFYTASGNSTRYGRDQRNSQSPEWFQIENGPVKDSKVITVSAFKLAEPAEILDSAAHGSIPPLWLRCGGWTDNKKPPPQEFWRTLVADRTNAGLDPEPGCPSIIQSAIVEKGVEYGINTNEFIHEKDNSAYYDVFRRVQAVVWNRKLIRAKLIGNSNWTEQPLGLVPPETQLDDSIYIVNGCSVPLVLRKKVLEGKTYYEMVGECYVDNMMGGRAIESKEKFETIKII